MKTRMKEYRARIGLTQEKLAELVGVRRETIIFLEKGNNAFKVIIIIFLTGYRGWGGNSIL